MKRVSSCIFVRRKWYGDVILFPFPLHSHWKASKDEFFFLHFFFSQKWKNQILLLLQKTWVLLLNILSKQLQTFPFTQRSFKYCQLLQNISSSPTKYCFALYCRHLQKVPEMTLKNPPFRSVHFDLTLFTQFFLVQKVCEKSTRREKKSQRQPKCLQHFWRGVQLHFFFFSKEVFFTIDWRVKPTKRRLAGTFRKTSLL